MFVDAADHRYDRRCVFGFKLTWTPADVSERRTICPLPAALSNGVMTTHPQRDPCGARLDHTCRVKFIPQYITLSPKNLIHS